MPNTLFILDSCLWNIIHLVVCNSCSLIFHFYFVHRVDQVLELKEDITNETVIWTKNGFIIIFFNISFCIFFFWGRTKSTANYLMESKWNSQALSKSHQQCWIFKSHIPLPLEPKQLAEVISFYTDKPLENSGF